MASSVLMSSAPVPVGNFTHSSPHGPFAYLSLLADFFSAASHQPYPNLPPELHDNFGIGQKLFETTLKPSFPLIFAAVYVALTSTLNHNLDGKNRLQGKRWKLALVLHNFALALYSGWTFYIMAPVTIRYYINGWRSGGATGLTHCFCDTTMSLWDSHLAIYGYLFYLSKFYEIIDSLILIGKGRRASLLQEYHHAGAMLTMWSGIRFSAPAIWLFVVFNSFIHTIMYSYYTTSVLRLPFPTILKKSLTKLQIAQFLIGGSLAASYLWLALPPMSLKDGLSWPTMPSAEALRRFGENVEGVCLRTAGQRLAVLMNVIYLTPLTWLFVDFYVRSYRKSAANKAAKAASAKSQ